MLKQPAQKRPTIKPPAIRQRIGTKRAENLDLLVRITFTNIEYRRGEQDCRTALDDDACALAAIFIRQLDWPKRLSASPHHEVRVKEEVAFDVTQQVFPM